MYGWNKYANISRLRKKKRITAGNLHDLFEFSNTKDRGTKCEIRDGAEYTKTSCTICICLDCYIHIQIFSTDFMMIDFGE